MKPDDARAAKRSVERSRDTKRTKTSKKAEPLKTVAKRQQQQTTAKAEPPKPVSAKKHVPLAHAARRQLRVARKASPVKRVLTRAAVAAVVFGMAVAGGVESVVHAASRAAAKADIAEQTMAPARTQLTVSWVIDQDGDGVGDLANPTLNGVRGMDAFGSGRFGAGRDKGRRAHHGVDYMAKTGDAVHAPIGGTVTRIAGAYGSASPLRFVELVNAKTGVSARILYVAPDVKVGETVTAGQRLGFAQDLSARYPGITNHVHVELRDGSHALLDAATLLPEQPIYRLVVEEPGEQAVERVGTRL